MITRTADYFCKRAIPEDILTNELMLRNIADTPLDIRAIQAATILVFLHYGRTFWALPFTHAFDALCQCFWEWTKVIVEYPHSTSLSPEYEQVRREKREHALGLGYELSDNLGSFIIVADSRAELNPAPTTLITSYVAAVEASSRPCLLTWNDSVAAALITSMHTYPTEQALHMFATLSVSIALQQQKPLESLQAIGRYFYL